MTLPQEGCLLRIFIGESDHHGGKPLHEWIVLKAREAGLFFARFPGRGLSSQANPAPAAGAGSCT